MSDIGKWFVVLGVLLVAAGALLWFGPKIPWLGRLPGDISVERPGFKSYFPLATCIVLSLVLTWLAWLWRRH
jgi:hypothetical protein